MNNIYDVLELCLHELENGADLEAVLARYPDLASELRPILNAAVAARTRSELVSTPSPDVIRRGRAKLLQHAAQMREAKVFPRKRMIPIFQRLAISFTLTALFLSSGTGLVSASSSALPGENLYPVKLTWENIRLFFTFNEEHRETLEHSFENERLDEVNELLVEGRDETIQFAGVYMEVNGVTYVSGIHIVILDTSILPAAPLSNGAAVVVTGLTNAQGFVDVESIELLPTGTIVPVGQPVEFEADHNDNNGESESGKLNETSDKINADNINDSNNDKVDENDSRKSVSNDNEGDGVSNNNDGSGSGGGNDDNSNSDGDGGDDDSGSDGGGGGEDGDSGGDGGEE